MRKLHDSVSDPKYEGVHTSRSKIFDDDRDISDEEVEAREASSPTAEGLGDDQSLPDEDEEENEGYSATQPFGQVEESDQPSDLDSDDESDDHSAVNEPHAGAAEEGDRQLAESLRKSREQDRGKGKAVVKQLVRCAANVWLACSILNMLCELGDLGRSPRCTYPASEVGCISQFAAIGASQ